MWISGCLQRRDDRDQWKDLTYLISEILYNTSHVFETTLPPNTHFEDIDSFHIRQQMFHPEDEDRNLFRLIVLVTFLQDIGDPLRQVSIDLTGPEGIARSYSWTPADGDYQGTILLTELMRLGKWDIRVEADGVGVGDFHDELQIQVDAASFTVF